MFRRFAGVIAAAILLMSVSTSSYGQQLVIGVVRQAKTLDPHFKDMVPNNRLRQHLFDTLIQQDANGNLKPGLATSWRAIDALTWEFQLRKDVVFHDGTPFTADDVIFTVQRIPRMPQSPAPLLRYTRHITGMEAPSPDAVLIRTDEPQPLFPNDLSRVAIVSRKAMEGKTLAELNTGEVWVGTGPYRFVSWVRGKQLVLARNESYWGGAQPWSQVVFRQIADEKGRIQAVGKGVDVVERVSVNAFDMLRRNRKISIVQKASNRLIYLHMDSGREVSPFVREVEDNPLQKEKVRRALSYAIDRTYLTNNILKGAGTPAGQFTAKGSTGYVEGVAPDKHDPKQAIRLLASAGYRNGFWITVHGPNNRFINDSRVASAIGQMLGRVGLRTRVDTMNRIVFFPRAAKGDFSLMLVGQSIELGDPARTILEVLGKPSKNGISGRANLGGYANKQLDELLAQVMQAVEPDVRERLLQSAIKTALEDYGIIPLYFERNSWAIKKPLKMTPRLDGLTTAMSIQPK